MRLGFLPAGPKRAIVANASKSPLDWRLLDAAGKLAASGKTQVFGADRHSGEHVHRVDFGAFTGTGRGYRLTVAGAQSRPFPIATDIYARLPYDALAYFYHNRAGTPIETRVLAGAGS